jgi:hypothetical protein
MDEVFELGMDFATSEFTCTCGFRTRESDAATKHFLEHGERAPQ